MADARTAGQRDLVIAADFGTSGVKVALVGRDLAIVARATGAYPLSLPAPGWAEQRPQDWWDAFAQALRRLAAEVPALKDRAAALVWCAQMCGVVCAAEDGTPLRPAMLWLDKRSAPLVREAYGRFPAIRGYNVPKVLRWLQIANGAPSLAGGDPPGKVLWLARHEPDILARTHRLLDVKDWLNHRATGRFVTTADSANLTWAMDTRPGREGWSPALAAMAGMPLDKLPEIVDGAAVVGGLTSAAAADLGLPAGLPVLGGASDCVAAALGSGAVGDGELHLAVGTSAWIGGFFPRRIMSPSHYATVTSSLAYRPFLIATQESAGAAFDWVARLVGAGDAGALLADSGPAHDDDPFFLPWLAGERVPVGDDRLRGGFHGLSLAHDRAALARAALEGVVLNTAWAYGKVAANRGVSTSGPLPLVGGVARSPRFAQALADALGRTVTIAEPEFAGALGAATIAAPLLGWHASVWDAARSLAGRPGEAYAPDMKNAEKFARRRRRLETIRPALVKLYRT